MRLLHLTIFAILAAAPVLAQQAVPDAPRYQVTPGESGVTRIDTQTGAVAHCSGHDGVWTCEPTPDASAEIGRVSGALNALSGKVDDLARRMDQVAPPAAPAQPAFAAEIVGRFLEMVRRLKQAYGPSGA